MKFSSLPDAVQVRLKEVLGWVLVVGGRCCEILAFTEGETEGERGRDGEREGDTEGERGREGERERRKERWREGKNTPINTGSTTHTAVASFVPKEQFLHATIKNLTS